MRYFPAGELKAIEPAGERGGGGRGGGAGGGGGGKGGGGGGEIVGERGGRDGFLDFVFPSKYCNRHKIVFLDGSADRFGQRTAVADAGGTTVTHEIEFQFVEILSQACSQQIVGDYL